MAESIRLWWKEDKAGMPAVLQEVMHQLDEDQNYRTDANLRNMRLYSNLAIMGLSAEEYTGSETLPTNRLTYNVVEAGIETAGALIGSNHPRVKFSTQGGKYESRKKAEQLNYFAAGMFHATKTYPKSETVFNDAEVFGTGFSKVYEDHGAVAVERVFPDEIIIDDVEGKYGSPRNLYIHKDVERSVLIEEYEEHAAMLAESGRMREGSAFSSGLADPCSVLEAWHLPSYPGAKDGLHIISTTNQLLLYERWDDPDFPLAVFRWCKRPLGFWGKGIPEQLRGIQIEMNMILQKVQRHMNLASSKVFVQKGSKVNKAQLNNKEQGLVEYAGSKPPVFQTIEAISPEYYAQIRQLKADAFELIGVSQAQAGAEKPKGLESGRAIMEHNDIQSRRFKHTGKRWEWYFVDLAEQMVRCAKRIADKSGGSYKIMAQNDEGLIEVDWKDINPGKDKYFIQPWPAALLPDSPSGQMQTVETLMQMDPRVRVSAMRMIKNPDVEAIVRRIYAPEMVVDKMIGEILDKGAAGFIPPSPYMDLHGAITQMQYALNEAMYSEVEEEKLQLFRDWIDSAAAILNPPPTPEELQMQQLQMQAEAMEQGGGNGAKPAPAQMPASQPTTPVGA